MYIISIILMITLPGLIMFCVEWIQIQDIQNTINWMTSHPAQTILGYCLVFFVFTIIYMIFGKLSFAMLGSSVIFITLSMVNYYKLIMRGDPLMPWDLMLNKEAKNIMAYIDLSIDKSIIIMLVILVICIVVLAFIKPIKINWKGRIIGVLIGLGITTLFMSNTYFSSENIEMLGIEDVFWNQKRNYEINGFLTGFSINIPNIIIKAPTGYTNKKVHRIINESEEMLPVFKSKGRKNQPNIIMIMNEAFWDPTLLTEITYSEDLIPTTNKIRREGASGWLLTPGYGGGTANTEFEVLTGNSVSFLPSGSMAYQQYINKPLGSMASYLKEAGYATVAIHPYQKWFWDRDQVYPYLGFDEFISDEDFIDPRIKGQFISDMETSHEIIRQYEKNKGKPFFNYTVTMQNHGPYDDRRYGDDVVAVEGEALSQESKEILQTYATGVKDGDEALAYLIDYFEEVQEPTMIVMFGDHLPMLGNEYGVYKEAGFISDKATTLEDTKKLHLTPLLIWNNYDNKKQDIGIMNASYLGAYTMGLGGMEMPIYFKFLNQLHQDLPAYLEGLSIESDGFLQERLSEKDRLLQEKHWMLQYDLMFGKEYGSNLLFMIR